jgi:hypothetical protein
MRFVTTSRISAQTPTKRSRCSLKTSPNPSWKFANVLTLGSIAGGLRQRAGWKKFRIGSGQRRRHSSLFNGAAASSPRKSRLPASSSPPLAYASSGPRLFVSVIARAIRVFFSSRRRAFAPRDLTPRTRNDAHGCIEGERSARGVEPWGPITSEPLRRSCVFLPPGDSSTHAFH